MHTHTRTHHPSAQLSALRVKLALRAHQDPAYCDGFLTRMETLATRIGSDDLISIIATMRTAVTAAGGRNV